MPIIPRYQPRGGPAVGELDYAGAYQPPGGEDWRMLGQAAKAGGAIAGAVQQWQSRDRPQAGNQGEPEVQPPASMRSAIIAGKARDVVWRREQLDAPNADIQAVARSRTTAAEGLEPAARAIFDTLTAHREAGFAVDAEVRRQAELQAAAEQLSADREALGVDEYLQLADSAPEQAKLALGSAIGERTDRLSAMGASAEAVDAGRRDLLNEAASRRVLGILAVDPDRAASVLDREGGMLSPDARGRLQVEVEAERTRRVAQTTVRRLAAEHQDLADDLDGLLAKAETAADPAPASLVAFRGAAIGAWRDARGRRETAEDAAWRDVEPYLRRGDRPADWTSAPGAVWTALSPRQREALRGRFESPWKGSDPETVGMIEATAANSREAFAEMDLTGLLGQLDVADFSRLRALQLTARTGGADWEQEKAALPAPGAQSAQPMLIRAAWSGPELDPLAFQSGLSEQDKALNRHLDSDPFAADGLHVNAAGQVVRRIPRRLGEPAGIPPRIWSEEVVPDDVARRYRANRLGVDPEDRTALADRERRLREAYFPDLAPDADKLPRSQRDQLRRRGEAAKIYDSDPRVRALGRVVAGAEGDVTYNSIGGTLRGADKRGVKYSRPVPEKHPGRISGRYQIDTDTWGDFGDKALGMTDYSPRTQDMTFVAILRGDKILDALKAGDFEKVVELASRRWASFPDPKTGVSRYTIGKGANKRPQPSVPMDELERLYKGFLLLEQGANGFPASPLEP